MREFPQTLNQISAEWPEIAQHQSGPGDFRYLSGETCSGEYQQAGQGQDRLNPPRSSLHYLLY